MTTSYRKNGNAGIVDPQPIPVIKWAALAGVWSFEGCNATFQGPSPGATTQHGLAISNARLRDGIVHAKVTLETVASSSGGIVLGFGSDTASYVVAQVGGFNAGYSISEFDPAVGWRALVTAGSSANLQPDREYLLEVRQQGQKVSMMVNEVQIFEYVLPRPLGGNQVGLFAWSSSPVKFLDVTAQRQRPRAFVAMPFSEPFNTLYKAVIRPEADELGFSVVRVDEISGPGIIFEDIKREIAESKVVIAEITAPNQNVFYELGYAHALNKPTVLLAQRGKELPFDIRSYRVIFYEDSIGGKPIVEESLRKHLHAILKEL